jgi:hypothetical protein
MGIVWYVVYLGNAYVRLQTEVRDPLIESYKLFGMSYEKTIATYEKYLLGLVGMSSLAIVLSDNDASFGSK